jgi:transposase
MANFEKNTSSQGLFLSIQLDEQFSPDSREYILKEFVQEHVKVDDFEEAYNNDHSGRKVKNPQDIVAAILYGYITGNRSSRKIEELLKTHIGFMFISNCLKIDHSIICEFKVKFSEQIKNVFSNMLFLMNELEMIDWSLVVGDGTKIKAYASRGQNIGKGFTHKILKTYHKMADKIVERDIEIEKKFEEGEIDIKEHDAEKKRISRQKRKYEKTISKINACLADEEMSKRLETERINLTDPDSSLTLASSRTGYIQGYNAVLMVSNNDVILNVEPITNKESEHTEEMVHRVEELKKDAGTDKESTYLFDNGFQNMENTLKLEDEGLNMYIDARTNDFSEKSEKRTNFQVIKSDNDYMLKCRNNREVKGRQYKNSSDYNFIFDRKRCEGCTFKSDCYKNSKDTTKHKRVIYSELEVKDRDKIDKYLNKLRSEEGQKIYSKRFGKEHVNSNIKGQRNFLQTFYRGKTLVGMDLYWVAFAHNIRRYISFISKKEEWKAV